MPGLTLFVSWYVASVLTYIRLFMGQSFSKVSTISTLACVVGAALMVFRNPEYNNAGLLASVTSLIFQAIQGSFLSVSWKLTAVMLSSKLLKDRFSPALIIGVTAMSALLLFVPLYFQFEADDRTDFRDSDPNPVDQQHPLVVTGGSGFYLTVSALLASSYHIVQLLVVKFTSAHYAVLLGNLYDLLTPINCPSPVERWSFL